MNRCPITYELCEKKYSKKGLYLLSKKLKFLQDFPFTSNEQVQKALELATKLSIQGVQPKLSVKLNEKLEIFEVVESFGKYIIKPPHHLYEELPQNEDLTMKLATIVGIDVPSHGMIYNIDQSLSYFIKRFDRLSKNNKLAVEDFSQVLEFTRETKYDSSMEKIASALQTFCTFPQVEKSKLFKLIIFNFLIGNKDMHLKNYSLITENNIVKLSSSYDLINTSIVINATEEIALPIKGKKSKLSYFDLVEYFGVGCLHLTMQQIESELAIFKSSFTVWQELFLKVFYQKNFK